MYEEYLKGLFYLNNKEYEKSINILETVKCSGILNDECNAAKLICYIELGEIYFANNFINKENLYLNRRNNSDLLNYVISWVY
jgi:hypothetical protein